MDMFEYETIKYLTYSGYCDYLQRKYGIGLADYMYPSYVPNPKCKRTKEGLYAHHKKEDVMVMLSNKEIAKHCPFEWQQKENIVYCDFLEHLLLHILICKYPAKERVQGVDVGIGGVINFLVPELNDLYSGWKTNEAWRKACHDRVKDNKDVYLCLLKDFIEFEKTNKSFRVSLLCSSFNDCFGYWNSEQNSKLYAEIKALDTRHKRFRVIRRNGKPV